MDQDIKIKIQEIMKDEITKLEFYSFAEIMHSFHKRVLQVAYDSYNKRTAATARALRLERTTLVAMLRRYGIKNPEREKKFIVCSKCHRKLLLVRKGTTPLVPKHQCPAEAVQESRKKRKKREDTSDYYVK